MLFFFCLWWLSALFQGVQSVQSQNFLISASARFPRRQFLVLESKTLFVFLCILTNKAVSYAVAYSVELQTSWV